MPILNFLQNYFNGTTESPSNVIFYSDNCAGQNKNKFITSLYIYAVLTMNIQSIRHKFLIVGHTQNESDCMHSVIEKQKKKVLRSGPIYIPAQWVTLIKTAKQHGKAYDVKELSTEDFYDFKKFSENIGKNFNKDINGQQIYWNDIKEIVIDKSDPFAVKVRTSYVNTDYQTIKVNIILFT